MGWGSILHNALNDAKGDVDPRNYLKAGKMAVEHPLRFGKAVGKSYVDIAEHPIRELQNHPLNTLLQVAPVGKLATVGAEGAAFGAMRAGLEHGAPEAFSNRASTLAYHLGQVNKATDVTRPIKVGVKGVKAEATLYRSLKYDPGSGPTNPHWGNVAGSHLDSNKLGQLQADLGHPNTTYSVDYPKASDRGLGPNGDRILKGEYRFKDQHAAAFLHPEHLVGDKASKGADLTNTLLHEARHGWQKANWSRPSRFIDTHLPYKMQRQERDANRFSAANREKYDGLIQTNPMDPKIPMDKTLPGQNIWQFDHSLPTDFEGLQRTAEEVNKGMIGTQPGELLDHMQKLVEEGKLHPDDAMDVESMLEPSHSAAYKAPTSSHELLARAVKRSRGPGHSVAAADPHFDPGFVPTDGAAKPSNASLVASLRASMR